ncbi:hypothetical protein PoB_003486800, partial [Plakobranchus ocellatus]
SGQQQDDLRLSSTRSDKGASGGTRPHDRGIAVYLTVGQQCTLPPTPVKS